MYEMRNICSEILDCKNESRKSQPIIIGDKLLYLSAPGSKKPKKYQHTLSKFIRLYIIQCHKCVNICAMLYSAPAKSPQTNSRIVQTLALYPKHYVKWHCLLPLCSSRKKCGECLYILVMEFVILHTRENFRKVYSKLELLVDPVYIRGKYLFTMVTFTLFLILQFTAAFTLCIPWHKYIFSFYVD